MIELAQQLAVIMIGMGTVEIILLKQEFIVLGKQVINNAQEILIPKLKAWWQNHSVRKKVNSILKLMFFFSLI